MIEEHSNVILCEDLREDGLRRGDVGFVVHTHKGGEAYEVEFLTMGGSTVAVRTLQAEQVRAVNGKMMPHVTGRSPFKLRLTACRTHDWRQIALHEGVDGKFVETLPPTFPPSCAEREKDKTAPCATGRIHLNRCIMCFEVETSPSANAARRSRAKEQ